MNEALLIILCLAGLGLLVFVGGLAYGLSRPTTSEEKQTPLPGDDLIARQDRIVRGEAAITIDAPPNKVWPYLAQMGQQHGGFYSFEGIERLLGFGIKNTYVIRPEWQGKLNPGFWMFFHKNGIGMEVIEVEEGKYFTMRSDSRKPPRQKGAIAFNPFRKGGFAFSWVFVLKEMADGKTRLITRSDLFFAPCNSFTYLLIFFTQMYPSIIMITGLLNTVKACAEGRGPKK
jgi:hypothetical protein